eukprot:3860131-Pyramimonas_sp.AAC.1
MEGHRSGHACLRQLSYLHGRRRRRQQHAAPSHLGAPASISGAVPAMGAGGDDPASGAFGPQRVSSGSLCIITTHPHVT